MERIKCFLVLLLLISNGILWSQNDSDPLVRIPLLPDSTALVESAEYAVAVQSSVSLPEFTTPSPKATAFDRYGNYPTNLYTGLVDITIPIHYISVNGMEVPIEFKYHASGLKYDDVPLELGYGWTLFAGGIVSYSARGAGRSIYGNNRGAYLKDVNDIALNDKTGHPDSDQLQLDYVMNGSTTQSGYVDTYRDSEHDLYKFSFLNFSGELYFLSGEKSLTVPNNNLKLYGSSAIDENGITYLFSSQEPLTDIRNDTYYLEKIISADKADTIYFKYKTFTASQPVRRPIIDRAFTIKQTTFKGGYVDVFPSYEGSLGINYKNFYPAVLTEIVYRGGKVTFTYNATQQRSLEQINIWNIDNTILKTVTLNKTEHSVLNKVTFKTRGQLDVYSYEFGYNGVKPMTGKVGIDYWGFYNGRTVTSPGGYLPDFTIPHYSDPSGIKIQGMNRNANEHYMKLGILNKIVYPTKGYSIFEYEAHRANNSYYGGLRIKEIYNYNHDGSLHEKKWYKYGENESGNGILVQRIDSRDFMETQYIVEQINGSGSAAGPNIGDKILYYTYGVFPRVSYFSAAGSTVVYDHITEYSGTQESHEKTIYKYTHFNNTIYPTRRGFRQDRISRSSDWKNGKLKGQYIYNKNGELIYSLENNYTEINKDEVRNLRVLPYANIVGSDAAKIKNLFSLYSIFSNAIEGSLYDYFNYYITTGQYAIISKREFKDGVSISTSYTYNNIGQVIQETITDSEKKKRTIKYKYPYDMGSTAPYNTMYSRNIINPVIEQETLMGETSLEKVTNQYKSWNTNMFAPEFIKTQSGTNTVENRIQYHQYDKKGNPNYISMDDATKVVYIWGYNYQYLIAEIKNATYAQVLAQINQQTLDQISVKNKLSTDDMNRVNNLRTSLPSAHITTYTYTPGVGVTNIRYPDNTSAVFNYDDFGRLKDVYFNDGTVSRRLETYEYNFKR